MSEQLKFWMDVYIAAIRSGSSYPTANREADQAVKHLMEARQKEAQQPS